MPPSGLSQMPPPGLLFLFLSLNLCVWDSTISRFHLFLVFQNSADSTGGTLASELRDLVAQGEAQRHWPHTLPIVHAQWTYEIGLAVATWCLVFQLAS